MIWSEIRNAYPHQWLIVEALAAHTTSEKRRELDRMAIIEQCENGNEVLRRYRELHKQYPLREFYFVHTDRNELLMLRSAADNSPPGRGKGWVRP
ncbi:hypothetical protein U14_02288 [Candidatus Moduliflexus flocculans]|uniref:Uncharacterized protein n=1 Tax=Candidatus Moduliflexus flocculans TaxID=1499966 RepID=A0A0S6VZL6_9BACT|nr:hypothetical protein U14_02288 [Candidatus Moduliflexus flocculans]